MRVFYELRLHYHFRIPLNSSPSVRPQKIPISINPIQPNDFIANAFCLEFADDGSGLSTNNPEEIFEASYSTKKANYGTGLGLFIARRLARIGGGYLEVIDTGLGQKGVTFRLTLPCKTGR